MTKETYEAIIQNKADIADQIGDWTGGYMKADVEIEGFFDVKEKAVIAAYARSLDSEAKVIIRHAQGSGKLPDVVIPSGMIDASEIEAEWARVAQRLRIGPDKTPYGARFGNHGQTWAALIEAATTDMGLSHPDELDHVHVVFGLTVEHGNLNWHDQTVDFDSVHRYPFDAPAFNGWPEGYSTPSSISLDIAHP